MAQRTTLPGVTSRILDYGLGVGPEPTDLNDSILIIGTASDGPMYEPIPLPGGKDQSQLIFGSFGDGSLVRGFFESLDATIEGTPDIRAMRIGNGQVAYLDIAERLSTSQTWDSKTTGRTSLRLEAIYPGNKYNAISVYLDAEKKINIFNPKTGLTSKFTYDDTNPNNSAVDARDIRELVNTINADPNISSVLVASASGIQTQYEVEVSQATDGVSVESGKAILDLRTILSDYDSAPASTPVVPTGYIFEADTSSTAGNLIDILDEVFSISVSTPVLIETKGKTLSVLEYTPFDGKGDSRINTIQALEDYGSDNTWQYNPSSGSVVSEYMSYLDEEAFTDATTSGLISAFSASMEVKGWTSAPDDSQEPLASGVAQDITIDGTTTAATTWASGNISMAWASGNAAYSTVNGYLTNGIDVDGGIADYVNITSSGVVDGSDASVFAYPGQIKIQSANTDDPLSDEWTDLYYHPTSGIYIKSFAVSGDIGTLSLGIGSLASGVSAATTGSLVGAGLINASGNVVGDQFLRISCNTCKGFLSEAATLPALEAETDNWRTYFVKGKELLFSNTVPFKTVFNYGTKVNYEVGSDVTITDSYFGKIKFNGSIQPGAAGSSIHATHTSIIGLKYRHLPQFPAITTAAMSLDNGTDGTGISKKALFTELETAYEALENYNVNIVIPMGAYVDSVKDGYNAVTGLPETVNAQYQIQFNEFLDNVSINVNETIGVLGVEPSVSSTLAATKLWVKRLTEQDFNDPTRGANIIPLLSSKYISICAFEPVFDNIGGLPYSSNGQAAYGGMISSLIPHQAPTNKSVPNARRTRFELSNSQLESLSAARLVSMRNKPGRNPVITDAMTAAPYGSDFVRLTTTRITFAAMDVVRQVCDPFIGQPNDKARRNAMEASITKGLSGMVDAGALRAYDFTVVSTSQQQVNGIIEIELILVPVFEIRKIRTTVKLRTELPTA